MADVQIAGIMRAGIYSPNHIGNDAAIFNAVADQLRKRGYKVNIYNERQFIESEIHEDVILDMCREPESVERLQDLEQQGRLVINSGFGIANCIRERMARLLIANGIPYPESLLVDTNENILDALKERHIVNCWVKRGDSHSQHKEDVTYCRHEEEAQELLHEYFFRGIRRAVVNRHLEGDLVKFYGLADGSYFYSFFPFVGLNSTAGRPDWHECSPSPAFSEDALKAVTLEAARLLDVDIYGGDCIVAPDGSFQLIDFNDWPSFAPCRKEAAPKIARYVISKIKHHISKS